MCVRACVCMLGAHGNSFPLEIPLCFLHRKEKTSAEKNASPFHGVSFYVFLFAIIWKPVFVCLSVCVSEWLLTKSLKKVWTDFHNIFRKCFKEQILGILWPLIIERSEVKIKGQAALLICYYVFVASHSLRSLLWVSQVLNNLLCYVTLYYFHTLP